MRHITRFAAVILAAFALPTLVHSATARADFQYDFRLVGTIVEVDDLAHFHPGDNRFGQEIHLLPGTHVGDPIMATGSIEGGSEPNFPSFLTDATLTSASFSVGPFLNMPPNFLPSLGVLLDPENPDLGFNLSIGGSFPTSIQAALPHRGGDAPEILTSVFINGSTMTVNLFHDSLQVVPITPSFRVEFSSIDLTAVPEPGSLALLAIGLAGGWSLLRRRRLAG